MKLFNKLCDTHLEFLQLETEYYKLKSERDSIKKLIDQNVIHNGYKEIGNNNDYGISWYVFPASLTDDQITDRLINLNIVEHSDRGQFDTYDWDCSGSELVSAPTIKRTKTRVLVTQSHTLDI
tara:strand:+ start:67 stop:435 length:369 start_codon:yes stop_codon:yes gene_type:complete